MASFQIWTVVKGTGDPYSIAEHTFPALIPVLGSHKPDGRLPLLSARPLRGMLPILLLGEQRHDGCEQLA